MRITGLCGFSGVGKDTVAEILVRHHNFIRIGLADPLREMLWALNPIVAAEGLRVREIVETLGWDQAKRTHAEIRQLLQRMGTEAGRKILGEDIWIQTAHERIPFNAVKNHNLGVVIPDVRFPNEAQWIHDIGGKVVRITRPGYGPVNSHISDAGIPEDLIDWTIDNGIDTSYDPEHIRAEVNRMLTF